MVLSTPALADSECTYVDKTVVQTTGTIEQTRNYEYETAQYTEEKRVCAVKLDVKKGKKWAFLIALSSLVEEIIFNK